MFKLNERQKRTLKFLWLSTAISWACIYPIVYNQYSFNLIIVPPLLFSSSLIYSNRKYTKALWLLISIIFLIIFFGGTLLFSYLGQLIFENIFAYYVFGCASAFALVILTIKLFFKNILIGLDQIILIIILPFVSVLLLVLLLNESIFQLPMNMHDRLDLIVLVYQFFMSIFIVSTMGIDEPLKDNLKTSALNQT